MALLQSESVRKSYLCQGTLEASLQAREDGAPKFVKGQVLESTFSAATADGREVTPACCQRLIKHACALGQSNVGR